VCVFLLGAPSTVYTFYMYKHRARTPVAASVWFYYVLRSYRDHPRASVYFYWITLCGAARRGAPRAIMYISISQCIIASDKKYTLTHTRAHIHIIYTESRICASCLYLSRTRIAAQKIVSNGFRFFPNHRNDLFVLTDYSLYDEMQPAPSRRG
jgi:hypothetical protein